MIELLPVLMFVVLLALIMTGFPVAFTLAGTALLFAALGAALEVFHLSDLGFVPARIFGVTSNFTLVAVPLFVFMGLMLEVTGLAEELLSSLSSLIKRQRGALALAVVLVGALLAASTGIVGATVVTMGVVSLPAMLERGYDKAFAAGTIAAAGTLGQIIPPSIVLVLLGDMMNVDVGDLFVAAIVPGLLLSCLYAFYVKGYATYRPSAAPLSADVDETVDWYKLGRALLPPLTLMFLVLGTILFGLASPTEAAGCGAAGALVIALMRGQLSTRVLREVSLKTSRVTAMVFMILVGAQFFGIVFRGLSGDEVIVSAIDSLAVHPSVILLSLMLLLFVLGFFLDFLEICFIVIPVMMPIISKLGFDPLWVAVLIAINLQTSFLTPPFGFALFYLKGVAPPSVSTLDIYRGVIPFVLIQVMVLLLLMFFPDLCLWLPNHW